jgi:Putative zinc-finger
MSAICERVRSRLPEYGREALPAVERHAVREHLLRCAACRAQAAADDPVLLFAGLPAEAVSSEEVASVVASVRAGIALRQAERRIERPSRRRGERGRRRVIRVGAAAAVVLLTLAIPSGLRSPAGEERAAETERAPAAAFSTVAGPESAAKASGGATIYDWNGGAGEPRVVWIVDGSLDI